MNMKLMVQLWTCACFLFIPTYISVIVFDSPIGLIVGFISMTLLCCAYEVVNALEEF